MCKTSLLFLVAGSRPVLNMEKALRVKRLWLSGSPGKTRTCNLLVNSQTLLPIELPGSAYNSESNFKEQRNQLTGSQPATYPVTTGTLPGSANHLIVKEH